MKNGLLCAGALSMAAACGGGTPYSVTNGHRDGRVEPRHYASLVRHFESEASCTSTDEVTVTALDTGLFHAEGCAHEADFGYNCGARGVSNHTCWWTRLGDLHAQAEQDSGCPADAIDVRLVEPRIREASGCGTSTRYVLSCDEPSSFDESCVWSHPDVPPPAVTPSEPGSPYLR